MSRMPWRIRGFLYGAKFGEKVCYRWGETSLDPALTEDSAKPKGSMRYVCAVARGFCPR